MLKFFKIIPTLFIVKNIKNYSYIKQIGFIDTSITEKEERLNYDMLITETEKKKIKIIFLKN